MTKATSSATDFLALISGSTEPFEVDGATVELRSLTFTESQTLGRQYADDSAELTFQAVKIGLVAPVLTAEQVEQMRKARPGAIQGMGARIMVLSGLAKDETAPTSPLAGGGSSASPATEPPT